MSVEELVATANHFLRSIHAWWGQAGAADELKAALEESKRLVIASGDDGGAKEIWCLLSALTAQMQYLQCFRHLKLSEWYPAWCLLERCELELRFLRPHFHTLWDACLLEFIDVHIRRWQSIFPYKIFMSPEILEHEKRCSICDSVILPMKPCPHRAGEVYRGELCLRRVTKAEILGISLVRRPVQKYSVLFTADPDKPKGSVDQYDYSLVQFAIARLRTPLDGWSFELTKERHPHRLFKEVGRNDPCPCESKIKYKKCCLAAPGVLRPHYEFRFSVPPPPDLESLVYHY